MALLGCSQEIGVRTLDSGCEDVDGDLYCSYQDCDDEEAAAYPGGDDVWYDGIDGDCDGADDFDADRDGSQSAEHGGDDCDDTDDEIGPHALDTWYDGIDSDCDGANDYDADGDGHDSDLHGGDDCDDSEPLVAPSLEEVWYDGLDNDCDGGSDLDADGDTFDSAEHGGDDCDDADATIFPGAEETWSDGVDQDCDGADVPDADGDGYESATQGGDDCDDGDASVYPGAEDTWYDGIDSDCAGDDDYDADLDGYQHDGYGGDDCDDGDADIHPGGSETWYDGVDGDCDGGNDYDADGDGYERESWGADCDDGDASVNPAASETWYDGVDGNCDDGDDYDADGDGYQSDSYGGEDCDDSDGAVSPDETLETVGDGVDQDCDGYDATGPWEAVDIQVSSGIHGVGVAETDMGVLVHFYAEDILNTGFAGALWTYYDPAAPWSGTTGADSWTFSTSVPFGATDVGGDGAYLIEAYTIIASAASYLYVDTTNVLTGSYNSLYFLLPPGVSDLDDVQVGYDGSTWGIVGCEGVAVDNLAYLEGTTSELYGGTNFDSLQSQGEGGEACAVDASSGDIRVSTSDDNLVTTYTLSGTTFSEASSFSSTYTDIEYSWDGSTVLYGFTSSSGLKIDDGSNDDTITTSGSPAALNVHGDGSDVYAVYVDTSDDLWLVYGDLASGLTEVPLETGLSGVDDADLLVTGDGTLVVVAQGSDAVSLMAVSL